MLPAQGWLMNTRFVASCLMWLAAVGCASSRPVAVLVRDAETHAPVPGAAVELTSSTSGIADPPAAGTTGPDGVARVALHDAKGGGTFAVVHASGYLSGGEDLTGRLGASHDAAALAVV